GNTVIVTSFNNTPDMQKGWLEGRRKHGDNGAISGLIEAYLKTCQNDVCEKYLGSTYKISTDGGYTFGEMKRSPVTSPHGPFVDNNGGLIWVGRVFAESEADNLSAVALAKYEDGEFRIKTRLAPCKDEYGEGLSCEPHAIMYPNGDILVAIRVQRGGEHPLFTVYTSRSTDGGKSFTVPKKILPDNAGSPPHLLITSKGETILSYACRKDNCGIRARISTDNGFTFGEEIKLTEHALNGDLGYPATIELSDGTFLTVWYENEGKSSVIKEIKWII
ncbi:MAG: exo-alpha-sialidase, partial [Clostridia bacterium]|nr:exo-alpha-sialidase [Clostridia bacterium]